MSTATVPSVYAFFRVSAPRQGELVERGAQRIVAGERVRLERLRAAHDGLSAPEIPRR
jgi:hypothetical protein